MNINKEISQVIYQFSHKKDNEYEKIIEILMKKDGLYLSNIGVHQLCTLNKDGEIEVQIIKDEDLYEYKKETSNARLNLSD